MTCSREKDSWRDEEEQEEQKQLHFRLNDICFCVIVRRTQGLIM